MKNQSFTIKCDNCGNETVLKCKVDAFYTDIQVVAKLDFCIEMICQSCNNSIETE